MRRLHFLLAMVAGIMSFISLNELVPVAVKHCGAYPAALATGAGGQTESEGQSERTCAQAW